jgi:hypothetical protein
LTDHTPIDYASSQLGANAPRRRRNFLATPIGWPLVLVTGMLSATAIYSVRNGTSGGLESGLLLSCNAVLLAGAMLTWLVRCLARYDLVSGRRDALPEDRRIGWPTVAVPLIAIGAALTFYFNLHTRLMFECSQSSFDAAIKAAPPGTLPPRGRYRLYQVDQVIWSPNGNPFFVLENVGFLDPQYIGFEYAPAGLPTQQHLRDDRAIDLGGGWYWNHATPDGSD